MTLNKLLSLIAGFIFVVIVAVTAVTLTTNTASPGDNLRHEDPLPKETNTSSFTQIGQLRIYTKPDSDEKRSVVILSPWISYTKSDGDTAFFEELASKSQKIRSIFLNYFSQRTKEELLKTPEDKIKYELKVYVNEILVLGKIEEIFFNDYQFLD